MKKSLVLIITLALLIGLGLASGAIQSLSSRIASTFSSEETESKSEIDGDESAEDHEGAIEYELNMTKDPATGKIPEGIREMALAQANEVLREQKANLIPEFASYSFQGPNNLGGRTRSVAYDVRYDGTTNRIILGCGISGGVYKSIDDGATWTRKSPTGQHFSCTSLAQDPRSGSQDTWYYSVGEASGNSTGATGAFYTGNGIYKSTDNGETWSRLANSNTSSLETFSTAADIITKVLVDPTNGNVYAACAATVLRSTDGGTTWGTVLSGTLANSGQFTDIVVTNTGRFYAGFGGTNSAGSTGVWTSTTGASASWTRIAGPGGTPTGWNADGGYGRVVLAIAPSNQATIYVLYFSTSSAACPGATVEADFFKLDMTTPASPVWTDRSANLPDEAGCLSGNDPFAAQGGYDLVVAVKPDNENTVIIGGTNIYRSTNGFASTATTTRIGGYVSAASYGLYANSHPDIHALVFQPTNASIMLSGNDGGIQRTSDVLAATVAWTPINNGYRTYQFYYAVNDPRTGSFKVLGGAQDNGSTRNIGGTGFAFEMVTGGDGVSVGLSDPAASGGVQYEYVGSQLGNINRRASTTALGFINAVITPTGESGSGLFVTLFKLDPDNSETLYYANDNILYRTTSASTVTSSSWTSMTGIATAVGAANDITAIAMSRGAYAAGTSSLFFGTSNGRVYRLDNPTGVAAATAPVDITDAAFPAGAYVSSIAVGPTTDDTVLVTFSNYGVSSIWATSTANSLIVPTWSAVEGNISLPSVRSSAIVLNGASLNYYVGTSAGLFATAALAGAGTVWAQEGSTAMGNAVVTSLDLRPADNKLLVGTHGYGMWTNLSPSAASASISGRVLTSDGSGVRNAVVVLTDANGLSRNSKSSTFGYYNFEDVATGQSYVLSVNSKRFSFSPRSVTLGDDIVDFDFVSDK